MKLPSGAIATFEPMNEFGVAVTITPADETPYGWAIAEYDDNELSYDRGPYSPHKTVWPDLCEVYGCIKYLQGLVDILVGITRRERAGLDDLRAVVQAGEEMRQQLIQGLAH